jgi:ribonuclease HI
VTKNSPREFKIITRGYGYLINRFGRTIYEGYDHMGPRATVFLAEVRAISTVAHTLMQHKNQNIIIRCDSQAAILAINNTNISSKTVLDNCLTDWGPKINSKSAGSKPTLRMRAMSWLIVLQRWARTKRLDPLALNTMKRSLLSLNLL